MTNHVPDDDFLDIRPWPISELAGTLVAKAALVRRGAIEADEDADVYERETDRFELDAWARTELTAWLKPADATILESAIGTLDADQLERCDTAAFQASTIAWAVNVIDAPALPLFSDGAPEGTALDWAPGPWTPVRSVTGRLRIRSDDALARERERWEVVAWRLALPEPLDREAERALMETIDEITSMDLIPVSHGDLVTAAGIRFGLFDEATLNDHRFEAETRLRTLNWICGLGEDIDTAPLFPGE